jgi:hypothetical protein
MVRAEDVLDATPADRARAAADALGDLALVWWCAELITGAATYGDPAAPDPAWLAGRLVRGWGSPDHLDAETEYWARVWAARTLLYVWDEDVADAVVEGLGDPAWRVREMCAKVSVRWEVSPAADACAGLVDDAVARVRAAAVRVLGAVGEAEHAGALLMARDDAEPAVRTAAEKALRQLELRLDRSLDDA